MGTFECSFFIPKRSGGICRARLSALFLYQNEVEVYVWAQFVPYTKTKWRYMLGTGCAIYRNEVEVYVGHV